MAATVREPVQIDVSSTVVRTKPEASPVHHPFLQVAPVCPIVGGDQASMTEIVGATEALSTTDLSLSALLRICL